MSLYSDDGSYHGETTHVYKHPEGKGFGEHHVEDGHPALENRSAPWQGIDGQHYEPRHGETSMADLDMKDGTEVQQLEDDEERNLKRVLWTDADGTQRITSVYPTLFDEYFQEVTA